jgi:exodeoxyribonuclease I
VEALIGVAQIIKKNQPKLFDFLLTTRDKREVAKLVNLDNPQPFVYCSGRYPKSQLHTTAAYPICEGVKPGSVIVYDLRQDPAVWADKTIDELKAIRFAKYEDRKVEGFVNLPAKELCYNRCPAVAPLGVIDAAAEQRIELDLKTVQQNLAKLRKQSGLADKLREVFARDGDYPGGGDAESRLYESFINGGDKSKMSAVRAAGAKDLADFDPAFADERLAEMLPRYKARNFPASLSESERASWEEYRAKALNKQLPGFSKELQQLASTHKSDNDQFLLQELQLWAESINPVE